MTVTRSSDIVFFGLTLIALVVAAPTARAADFTLSNGDKVTFYGQIDAALIAFDDGVHTYTRLTDNSSSNTRVGFTYTHKAQGVDIQFRFETGFGLPASSKFSQNNRPDFDFNSTAIRKLELSFKAGTGRFYLGQGSMATDGLGEVDLSGTSVAGYAGYDDIAGSYFFRDNASGALSPVTVGTVFHDTDGARRFRVRYDTPDVKGFDLRVAYGKNVIQGPYQTAYYDAGLHFKRKFERMEVEAGAGLAWTDPDAGPVIRQSVASASVLFRNGLNATVSIGGVQNGGTCSYGKAGYIGHWVAAGETALAVEYFHSDGFGATTGTGNSWGLIAVQHIDRCKTELYAGYRSYRFADRATDYNDAGSLTVGARWKF